MSRETPSAGGPMGPEFLRFLVDTVGRDAVLDTPAALAPYREDYTELDPVEPGCVVFATTTAQVQAIVRRASETGTALTARVAGTNVGGLTLPVPGGVVLDLSRMNRIHEVNVADMYAVIEPGVTQRSLKAHLVDGGLPLTFGFALAPPDTSVLANCLLGGLTNRSLKYGDQSDSISGLEVVRHDGSLLRTGAWAVEGVPPYGLVPLPDLTGLFVAWQGTTGVATRMAFQLWPRHPFERRLFVLSWSAAATFETVRRLCRTELFDDLGGLSWPSGKMMLGVQHPHPEPAPGEPGWFLYVDITAEREEELAYKQRILRDVLQAVRAGGGARIEDPFDLADLVRIAPDMAPFAEFPTDLKFLTSHPGGGLSWVGTYGPLSRFEAAADAGCALMVRHGFPPLVVTRPMRGGHFGVLRFVTVFDKKDAAGRGRVAALNRELLELCTTRGFVMYKTPVWAWQQLAGRLDPGLLRLMREVKGLMDPAGVFNPGKLGL